jgi:glycosyltransferase involved in cell wall biosynthesis
VQGVKAKLFDPRSPQGIADQLESILKDPEAAETDAKASLEAISSWSWKRTAGLYLQTFEEALDKHV